MALLDIDRLCSGLSNMQADDLYCLDDDCLDDGCVSGRCPYEKCRDDERQDDESQSDISQGKERPYDESFDLECTDDDSQSDESPIKQCLSDQSLVDEVLDDQSMGDPFPSGRPLDYLGIDVESAGEQCSNGHFRVDSRLTDESSVAECEDDERQKLRPFAVPKIRGMPVGEAVTTLRNHIAAIPDMKKRLKCLSLIYTRLMLKGVVCHWDLYGIGDASGPSEEILITRFSRGLNWKHHYGYSVYVTKESTCLCILVPEGYYRSGGHEVSCLCFWGSPSCVAIYKPPQGYSKRQARAIRKMLRGDTDRFYWGEYYDLDSARLASTGRTWVTQKRY